MWRGPLHFDDEPVVPQALLEFAILAGGPDGEHAAGLERRMRAGDALIVVERTILRSRERAWSVVDVEQDRVEALAARAEGESPESPISPDKTKSRERLKRLKRLFT